MPSSPGIMMSTMAASNASARASSSPSSPDEASRTSYTAASAPANLLTPTPQSAATPAGANPPMSAAETAKRAQIHQTSQKFEASFLSVMLNEMFSKDDDNVDKAFTGGSGAKVAPIAFETCAKSTAKTLSVSAVEPLMETF